LRIDLDSEREEIESERERERERIKLSRKLSIISKFIKLKRITSIYNAIPPPLTPPLTLTITNSIK